MRKAWHWHAKHPSLKLDTLNSTPNVYAAWQAAPIKTLVVGWLGQSGRDRQGDEWRDVPRSCGSNRR